jgi:23S rRNA (uracil1939-C5)-methyltransferase
LELDIEAVDASGDGVAYDGGVRITVPFTIPGERVAVRVVRRGRDAAAVLEQIVRASPHRVVPRCRHFGSAPSGAEGPPDACGGCTWQHIAYPEQLRLKADLVRRLVAASWNGAAPAVLPTIAATPLEHPWGYRHKVHFAFGGGGRSALVMGHYVRGTRRVFQARECPVHDPRGNAFAFALRDACAAAGVSAAPAGTLRSVAVRASAASDETMATLVVTAADDRRLRTATQRALETPAAPGSFHLNLHDRPDPYIFGRQTRHVRGPAHLREQVAGCRFLISPTAFFQTNVHAAEILVRLVLDALPPAGAVLDLYAGVGLFALPLARRGDRILAIEENRAAAADGEAGARLNRVPAGRCRFVAARVEAALRTVTPRQARHVVLDPPREGCGRGVLDEVFGRLQPSRAAYVSCNPEALARDLPVIASHGYQVERLQPVDMFPHTAHVETVAILASRTRGRAGGRR